MKRLTAASAAGHKAINVITVDPIFVNLHRAAAAPAPRRLSAVIPDYEVVDDVVPNNESCAVETVCQCPAQSLLPNISPKARDVAVGPPSKAVTK